MSVQVMRDFDLLEDSWSGGRDFAELCDALGELENLESVIQEYLDSESEPTDCFVNDLMWFESDNLAQSLGYESEERMMNIRDYGDEPIDFIKAVGDYEKLREAFIDSIDIDDDEVQPEEYLEEEKYQEWLAETDPDTYASLLGYNDWNDYLRGDFDRW